MCFQGSSKFCLFCVLLYSFLPQSLLEAAAEDIEATTYSPVKDKLDPHGHQNDVYQLNDSVPVLPEKSYYIDKLMAQYGNGTAMTFEGFEHLLFKLGLGKIVIFDHSVNCHKPKNSSDFHSFHVTHNHSQNIHSDGIIILCDDDYDANVDHVGQDDNREHVHEHEDAHEDHDHDHDEHAVADKGDSKHGELGKENTTMSSHSKRHISKEDECLSADVFLHISKSIDIQHVTKSMFRDICPSLIYQISEDTCHVHHIENPNSHGYDKGGFHDEGHQHDDMEHDHSSHGVTEQGGLSLSGVPAKVWGYSTIAVVIISLVGLLGVAVIPIMQKVFYNHLLQFLVALAVGALSGDALLHLLPHAIGGGHSSDAHDDEDQGHNHAVYKGLCGLTGIYFFYIVERILTIVTDMKRRKKQLRKRKKMGDDEMDKIGEKLAADCDEMMMSVHPNKALRGYADEAHSEHCMISFENTTAISHQHGKHKHGVEEEEQVDMLSHSNGHAHGHSHNVDIASNSIVPIAYMLIMGDGIHNFSDGLAIGAAFSNSITGGFSTSVAVFCHELPHEIGDFAMLLRAGMAPKQAIIYNCLSSVLCFIGMLIGVAIGNIENASLWIFAVVGGMFLYIALVDMLPEMSSVDPKRGEHPFCHLALQLLGMLLGGSIMLVIALYEDTLKTILD